MKLSLKKIKNKFLSKTCFFHLCTTDNKVRGVYTSNKELLVFDYSLIISLSKLGIMLSKKALLLSSLLAKNLV